MSVILIRAKSERILQNHKTARTKIGYESYNTYEYFSYHELKNKSLSYPDYGLI